MKTTNARYPLIGLVGLALAVASAWAQPMPQDNWRYDGLDFSGPDTARQLSCIAIGPGGVYVGYGNPATAVVQFQESGVFVRQFGTFTRVLGIACDSAGNVFVFNQGDSKIKAYDQNGTFLREWGGPGAANGQFSVSSANSTRMLAIDKNDQVYVCDPGNTRVQVFDVNGSFLRKWGTLGSLPGQFPANDPDNIATSPNGWVYVECGSAPRTRIFSADGTFVKTFVSSMDTVSPDGLLLNDGGGGSSVYLTDAALATVFSGPSITRNSAAFNKRGDIYFVNATKVTVYEREYSGVQNSLLPPGIPQPVVVNVAQRAGVSLLDIDYKVTDADSPTVTTALLGFLGGNNTLAHVIPMSTFVEGTAANVGANIPVNVEKRVTWNMAADWSVDFAQVQIEVLAKDSRPPIGVHWITIPASGAQPAIEVSRKPVVDGELLNVWYWFVATHESAITFAAGSVKGTSGLYSGQTLAIGITSTVAGRLFALQKLGMRAITGTEISRAQAGNYGFVSVDQNSVVREAAAPVNFVSAWGYNAYGQTNASSVLAGATKIAAGWSTSFVVTNEGSLWAIGYNGSGELGDGTTTARSAPVLVATGVAQVSAGISSHTLFVKTDGTLWAAGANGNGEFGDGTTTARTTPVQVATGVAQVSSGSNHTLFVKTDGTLWATGYNSGGQLGDGTATQRSTPVQVATGVAQASAGGSHSLFIKTDGSLWAMGFNGNGQLGDGTITARSTPVQVATGVAQVTSGSSHTLFLKTDGTLWAMGENSSGQLGDGTTTQRNTPVQVATGVARVSTGTAHTLFVKSDGTLWAMGSNDNGELGDGTTTNRSTPVQVATGVSQVAAGSDHTLAIIGTP